MAILGGMGTWKYVGYDGHFNRGSTEWRVKF
jgi:hypothetical protein